MSRRKGPGENSNLFWKAAAVAGGAGLNYVKEEMLGPQPIGAPIPVAVGPGMEDVPRTDLGLSRRTYGCTMVRGRRKRPSVREAVNGLIGKNHQLYQQFNYSQDAELYRQRGTFPLVTQYVVGTSITPAATIAYPVYIFRLTVPCGYQEGGIAPLEPLAYKYPVSPVIGYRLISRRVTLGGPIEYDWIRVEDTADSLITMPSWNVKPTAIWTGATAANTNCSNPVICDGIPNCHRLCHQSSDCQILFTGAKNNSSDVKACIVQFSAENFAPPDEARYFGVDVADPGIDAGNITQMTNGKLIQYRGNITELIDEQEDENVLDAVLTPWLHNRHGHPLTSYVSEPGVTRKKAWYESSVFGTTLTSLLNTTLDQNPIQYKHRLVYRPNKWFNSNCEPDNVRPHQAVVDPRFQPLLTKDSVGVFPETLQQKWLMVSGFTHNTTKAVGAAFSNTTDPSFDVSIRSVYLFSRNQEQV